MIPCTTEGAALISGFAARSASSWRNFVARVGFRPGPASTTTTHRLLVSGCRRGAVAMTLARDFEIGAPLLLGRVVVDLGGDLDLVTAGGVDRIGLSHVHLALDLPPGGDKDIRLGGGLGTARGLDGRRTGTGFPSFQTARQGLLTPSRGVNHVRT